MKGKINILFFYLPFLISVLGVQSFISIFVSTSFAQILSYFNLCLVIIGTLFIIKQKKKFPTLIKLWYAFFLSYFAFGLLANAYHNTPAPILKTLVPVIFFISFSVFLSNPKEIQPMKVVAAIGFWISCILTIYLNYINFSLDFEGVYQYELSRAGGVYGDANQAALASIISFVLIENTMVSKNKIRKTLKVIALMIPAYSLLITFSKTGFVVFIIVLCLTYYKLFSPKIILVTVIIFPIFLVSIINLTINSDKLNATQKERVNSIINILTLQTDKIEFSERDVLLKNMMEYIYDSPIMGNGIKFSGMIRGHNTILGVWADAGIFVFLLFLFLLIKYYIKALISPKNIKFFCLSILVSLTFFMMSLQTIINQAYLIVLLILVAYILENKNYSINKISNYESTKSK